MGAGVPGDGLVVLDLNSNASPLWPQFVKNKKAFIWYEEGRRSYQLPLLRAQAELMGPRLSLRPSLLPCCLPAGAGTCSTTTVRTTGWPLGPVASESVVLHFLS